MSKSKQPVERRNDFWCTTCDPKGERDPMTPVQVKDHLATVHKILVAKGNRSLVQALDGSDFYSNVMEWTFTAPEGSEVKLTQVSSGPRKQTGLAG